MSVEITFAEDGGHGLVAKGTSVWEAAKRLGVHLRADCNGRGECDSCAVEIIQGAEVLSPVTELEQMVLGPERLGVAERLACQARLVSAGRVSARPAPFAASAKQEGGKVWRDLPLSQQVGAFIEVQATIMSEAVNTLRGKSNALVEKFLNLNQQKTAATQQRNGEGPEPPGKN